MVFDWFRRRIAARPADPTDRDSAAEAQESASELPVAAAEQAAAEEAAPPSTIGSVAATATVATAAAGPSGNTAATVSPSASKADAPEPTDDPSDPLAWAKAAYAHLKAQQEEAQQAAQLATEPVAAEEEDTAEDSAGTEASPVDQQQPLGMGLLAKAAAERQLRQAELETVATVEAPPSLPSVTVAPERPHGDGAASDRPQLGTFDADFTWSAEVLAAQGREIQDISIEEIDWLGRLRRGMEKTRRNFVSQLLENLGDDPLTPEVLDDLEALLLQADVGVEATDTALDVLRQRLNADVLDPAEGLGLLKTQLREQLEQPIRSSGRSLLAPERHRLNIWLLVGVNGVGKTTTLGKLANLAVRSGYSCLVAAADTFRAGAVQQVSIWAERSQVEVIANPSTNADPAAVVFDAIGAAQARKSELLLVDTAGRLQTRNNLMEELAKIRRVVDRLGPDAVVESLLVLDASQGQNGLRQALAFAPAAQLTGVVLTKLDGSAKGGVALAVSAEANLPIRFIGAGEGIRDLRPFSSFEFIEALLAAPQ